MSSGLQEAVASRVEAQRERLVALKKGRAAHKLGDVTVGMCIGGMRGIPGMVWETSELDPEEGIRFRGLTIPECQARLPAAKEGGFASSERRHERTVSAPYSSWNSSISVRTRLGSTRWGIMRTVDVRAALG